jgi:hypothetical protein
MTAIFQRRAGENTHQTNITTAIYQANATISDGVAELAGGGFMVKVKPNPRSTKDAKG